MIYLDDEEVTTENEKNMMTVTPDTGSGPTPSSPMLKQTPGTSVGIDGITTVSINASAAVVHPHHDIKKGKALLPRGQLL
jgi:hypothetical protein